MRNLILPWPRNLSLNFTPSSFPIKSIPSLQFLLIDIILPNSRSLFSTPINPLSRPKKSTTGPPFSLSPRSISSRSRNFLSQLSLRFLSNTKPRTFLPSTNLISPRSRSRSLSRSRPFSISNRITRYFLCISSRCILGRRRPSIYLYRFPILFWNSPPSCPFSSHYLIRTRSRC